MDNGKRSVIPWLDLSLLLPLAVTFTSFSAFFSPLRWDRKARKGWNWVFPFPHIRKTLAKSTWGRLWQNGFPWRQAFIKENRMVWAYFKIVTCPSPYQKHEGDFLSSSPWGPSPDGPQCLKHLLSGSLQKKKKSNPCSPSLFPYFPPGGKTSEGVRSPKNGSSGDSISQASLHPDPNN